MEKAMKDWTNYVFYGLAAAVLVLSYVATDKIENRLKSIENQLDIQAQIIDKLRN
tara:strand:- start:405 stop:569 length:165 start_codon:yes stop_codon:yes gene_type:complete